MYDFFEIVFNIDGNRVVKSGISETCVSFVPMVGTPKAMCVFPSLYCFLSRYEMCEKCVNGTSGILHDLRAASGSCDVLATKSSLNSK